MALIILLNNFFHDFSAAGWLFGSIILWSILKKLPEDDNLSEIVVSIIKTTLNLMKFSIAGIIIFGIVRALAYKQYEWSAAAGQSQVTLLIVKHVLFTVIFFLGLVYFLRAGKLIRKHPNEQNQ